MMQCKALIGLVIDFTFLINLLFISIYNSHITIKSSQLHIENMWLSWTPQFTVLLVLVGENFFSPASFVQQYQRNTYFWKGLAIVFTHTSRARQCLNFPYGNFLIQL